MVPEALILPEAVIWPGTVIALVDPLPICIGISTSLAYIKKKI